MLNKIKKLYQLVFNQFKFEIDKNNNLIVIPPIQISKDDIEDAKEFTKVNKSFIISISIFITLYINTDCNDVMKSLNCNCLYY